MEKRKLILTIIGGIFALLLLCVLVVGLVDGIWPWHGVKAYGKIFDPDATPAVTEPVVTEPTEETEPSESDEGGDSASISHTPVLEGENPDGSGSVKEEVEVGGNTGDNTGSEPTVPDADATIQGGKIPGWGD